MKLFFNESLFQGLSKQLSHSLHCEANDPPPPSTRLVEVAGHKMHWRHVPSKIGIKGNSGANGLRDVGCRKSPILIGHIGAGGGEARATCAGSKT